MDSDKLVFDVEEPQKKSDDYHTLEEYYKLPEGSRVELIDGVFYNLATPNTRHQIISGELSLRIRNHIAEKGGKCRVFDAPFTVQLNEGDDKTVQPDISVICDMDKLKEKGCVGAPDWIIEIVSPSNPGHDYLTKLNLYRNAGVREYWIVEPAGQTISVYRGDFAIPEGYGFRDRIKSGILEDLFIDFKEISERL